jgi:hypothetical protein
MAQDHGMKDLHTLLLLVVWQLWKHRNVVVFDGVSPSVQGFIGKIGREGRAWMEARQLRGDFESLFVEVCRRASSE